MANRDVFPLPVAEVESLKQVGLSRGTRQRISRRRAVQSAKAETIVALNSLVRSEGNASFEALHDLGPSVVQQDVLDYIDACQASYVPGCE